MLGMAIAIHLTLLVPVLLLYQSDWMAENVYDFNDSRILEITRVIPAGFLYLILAVGAPIWEETIFRLWMGLRGITIPIFTTGATVITFFNYSWPLAFGLGILVLILTFVYLPKLKHHMDIHFRWWFYGSVALFGLAHLGNFELSFLALPLIIPQLLLGVLISLIRAQRGFLMGVVSHALWNGLVGLAIILPYLISSSGEVETDTNSLSWEVGNAWTNAESFNQSSDNEVSFENTEIAEVLRWMIHQSDPNALVDASELLSNRVHVKVQGDLTRNLNKLSSKFIDGYGLIVDTVHSEEEALLLTYEGPCSAIPLTQEEVTVNKALGLYYECLSMNDVASLLQRVYGIKFIGEESSTNLPSYEFHLSTEGLAHSLRLLEKSNCIVADTIQTRVTRYKISSGGF